MESGYRRENHKDMVRRARKASIKRWFSNFAGVDSHGGRTVVLSYHSVNPDHPMGIRPERFEGQLNWLTENCTVISIHQLLCGSSAGQTNPAEPVEPDRIRVAITFDDGYADMYHHALPLLRRFDMTATLFFVSAFAGSVPPERSGLLNGLELMSWDQIREIQDHGIQIECHTHHHTNVIGLSDEEMRRELRDGKEAIERETGTPVRYFAFPWGHAGAVSEGFAANLRSMGFKAAFTTMWGPVKTISDTNCFLLPRLDIAPEDTIDDFRRKLVGCYDYLAAVHRAKYAYHTIRRRLI